MESSFVFSSELVGQEIGFVADPCDRIHAVDYYKLVITGIDGESSATAKGKDGANYKIVQEDGKLKITGEQGFCPREGKITH